jgi:hypothetical protein
MGPHLPLWHIYYKIRSPFFMGLVFGVILFYKETSDIHYSHMTFMHHGHDIRVRHTELNSTEKGTFFSAMATGFASHACEIIKQPPRVYAQIPMSMSCMHNAHIDISKLCVCACVCSEHESNIQYIARVERSIFL